MAERRKTPDVLTDLLGGKSSDTSMTVKQHTGKTARRQASKTAQGGNDEKFKATFYLSPSVEDALEELRLRLRKMARREDKAGISKSAIVEMAILMALEDLEVRGEKSQLAGKLVGEV